MHRSALALLSATLLSAGCAVPPPGGNPAPGTPRVHSTADGRAITWGALVERLAAADFVLVGEQHDDTVAHRLERRLVEDLSTRRAAVVSLEMFERDVQPLLDRYLAGAVTEEAFLAGARPWPNYARDYRPIVELARARRLPVIASNVPRRLASAVARGGLDSLARVPEAERPYFDVPEECPRDEYFERFTRAMGEHPGMDAALVTRMYLAQCLKDEVMARSLAAQPAGPLVVHFNGAFHSDHRLGVTPRLQRLRPGARIIVVTLSRDPDAGAGDSPAGDFVVHTAAP